MIGFFLLVNAFSSVAQEDNDMKGMIEIIKLFRALDDEMSSPNYLEPLLISDTILSNTRGTNFEETALTIISNLYSWVGEYQKSLELYSKTFEVAALTDNQPIDLNGFIAVDAVQEIIELAGQYDVIFINDVGHRPEKSVFVTMLLEDLMNQGYTKIVFDEIDSTKGMINLSKIPTENLSLKALAPNYANLVRTSLSLGYEIVLYPYISITNYRNRDSIFALEIFDQQNIDMAKMIVFYNKDIINASEKTLAYWLELLTGKAVLNIDQIKYSEEHDQIFESPFYQKAVELNKSKLPFILKNKDDYFQDDTNEGFDFYVFHPRTSYTSGRASWETDYVLGNKKYLINLPKEIYQNIPEGALIQVFYKQEFDSGIPIDQILYKGYEDTNKPIVVPEGRFILRVEGMERSNLLQFEFTYDLENGLAILK
ncbi:hypothetical protein GCM10007940_18710 [Portibacter lacus]|uniref:Uncharacterized protein n=2 Tax=Portibacter lacus TaxID=1099794 RepID=A0AA37SR54_9BACT|nr:hypothetical protein GCM10007940_18710 [Portibacter lacus]